MKTNKLTTVIISKKKLAMVAVLIILIIGGIVLQNHLNSLPSDTSRTYARHKFSTIRDNNLEVKLVHRSDSIFLIEVSAQFHSDTSEYIELEYLYGDQKVDSVSLHKNWTMGKTIVLGNSPYDFCHPNAPEKGYTVNISSRTFINGKVRKLLVGEVRFLNPKNGIFEDIVMLECVRNHN